MSDVRLYRDGLLLALAGRNALRTLGVAADAGAARALAALHAPDVVLLDTGMPGALDLARALRREAPSVTLVAFAVADVGPDVVACAEAGIAGYVPRDASVDDVVAAIHAAMRGELHCSPHVTASLFARIAALSDTGAARGATPRAASATRDAEVPLTPVVGDALTRREHEIVRLIDAGLSNKEIGARLRIGTATVKNHVHHILEKLHVRRRGEAAARVRGHSAGATA